MFDNALQVRVPAETREVLADLAKADRRPLGAFIRNVLEDYAAKRIARASRHKDETATA